jgi:hypothetical protein
VDGVPLQNRFSAQADVPAETAASRAMSKDLSRAGFRFCGPTIVYAFMQATGMVNDHLVTCPRHDPVARLGAAAAEVSPRPQRAEDRSSPCARRAMTHGCYCLTTGPV